MKRYVIAATAAFILAGICGVVNAAPKDDLAAKKIKLAAMSEGILTPQYNEKSPRTAFLLSVALPGGGQFYNGEAGKGAAFLLTSAAGFLAFVYPEEVLDLFTDEEYSRWSSDDDIRFIKIMGAITWAGYAIWSVIDAPIQASKITARNKHRHEINAFLSTPKNPKFGVLISTRF